MSEAARRDAPVGEQDAATAELQETVSRLMRGLNHDLKNPLGAADGYLDLMLQGFRGDLTDEQRQTLERVRALIASGIDILEDVVTFARASIDELNVGSTETDLDPLVRMTVDGHRSRAETAGITLEVDGADGAARTVTDPDMVARILDRLLANALDHAPDGSRVDVRVRRAEDLATIEVVDSGPGVPAKDQERIFLEFERGDAPARDRTSSGIGFGLPLARALALQLGGDLRLESEAGNGATFTLELPLRS